LILRSGAVRENQDRQKREQSQHVVPLGWLRRCGLYRQTERNVMMSRRGEKGSFRRIAYGAPSARRSVRQYDALRRGAPTRCRSGTQPQGPPRPDEHFGVSHGPYGMATRCD
jgi:hypothetical protein